MPRYTLKQGDTLPILRETLLDEDGAPINLTGHTVAFHMRRILAPTATIDAAATVIGPTGGQVEYSWGSADMAVPGAFDCEWRILYADGRIQRSPSFQIEIKEKVA